MQGSRGGIDPTRAFRKMCARWGMREMGGDNDTDHEGNNEANEDKEDDGYGDGDGDEDEDGWGGRSKG